MAQGQPLFQIDPRPYEAARAEAAAALGARPRPGRDRASRCRARARRSRRNSWSRPTSPHQARHLGGDGGDGERRFGGADERRPRSRARHGAGARSAASTGSLAVRDGRPGARQRHHARRWSASTRSRPIRVRVHREPGRPARGPPRARAARRARGRSPPASGTRRGSPGRSAFVDNAGGRGERHAAAQGRDAEPRRGAVAGPVRARAAPAVRPGAAPPWCRRWRSPARSEGPYCYVVEARHHGRDAPGHRAAHLAGSGGDRERRLGRRDRGHRRPAPACRPGARGGPQSGRTQMPRRRRRTAAERRRPAARRSAIRGAAANEHLRTVHPPSGRHHAGHAGHPAVRRARLPATCR